MQHVEGVKKNWFYIVIAGLIIVFFKSIKTWLDRLLGNTQQEIVHNAQQQTSQKNYFDPNLWANYFSDETFNYTEYKTNRPNY